VIASFTVAGTPVTQGSKIHGVNPHTGKSYVRESAGTKLDHWRSAIAAEARRVGEGYWFTGPVRVELHFAIPKPASAPKLKRTWPVKARSGDVDKLARAALDAITHVLIVDDSQVVELRVTKDWADGFVGLLVELEEVL
jgi:crossover junction endodeoxyribonuclease RusA